jgi:methionine-S-sulfoxide reductase
MERSSFAAGCFWGVEHAFKQIEGVSSTEVGYQGGASEQVTYRELCTGTTGHAEAVLVTFDPEVVNYTRLLDAFFMMHDETELNRQGPDVGTQYRSALFPMTEQQSLLADKLITNKKEQGVAIVTTVEKGCPFIKAEENHQDYLDLNPGGYCHIGFDIFSRLKKGDF